MGIESKIVSQYNFLQISLFTKFLLLYCNDIVTVLVLSMVLAHCYSIKFAIITMDSKTTTDIHNNSE